MKRPKHFLKDKGFCTEFCRQAVRGQSKDNFSWATAIEPIPHFLGKLVKALSQQSAGVKRRRKKAREKRMDSFPECGREDSSVGGLGRGGL